VKPVINQQNAGQFTADLWQKITQTGFNALSKNDFYDYVLYLFNKYDANHFLSARPNYENAQTLRVTPQKIATSKENITLKYTRAFWTNWARRTSSKKLMRRTLPSSGA
jgi:hypothetical protein